jgi:hypothetical protein
VLEGSSYLYELRRRFDVNSTSAVRRVIQKRIMRPKGSNGQQQQDGINPILMLIKVARD